MKGSGGTEGMPGMEGPTGPQGFKGVEGQKGFKGEPGLRGYPGTCKRSKRSLDEGDSELATIYTDIIQMERRLNEIIVGSQR